MTARLRSAVRRRNAQDTNPDASIRRGEIELDPVKYRVLKCGRLIHLTPKEFEMLHFLMTHVGEAISQEDLLKAVWGPKYKKEPVYLRIYVSHLRKKIEDDPLKPQYLLTVPYVGYRFNEQQALC